MCTNDANQKTGYVTKSFLVMLKVLRIWFPKDIAEYITHLVSYQEWCKRIYIVNEQYTATYHVCHSHMLYSQTTTLYNYRHTNTNFNVYNKKNQNVAKIPKRYFFSNGL